MNPNSIREFASSFQKSRTSCFLILKTVIHSCLGKDQIIWEDQEHIRWNSFQ